jgi:hypothetical protein
LEFLSSLYLFSASSKRMIYFSRSLFLDLYYYFLEVTVLTYCINLSSSLAAIFKLSFG